MTSCVVVPSYNGQGTIAQCLTALMNQTLPPDGIIVVDSSNDATPDIIRGQFPQVKLHHLKKQTMPGAARNLGMQMATADIILFTDTDAVPDSGWIQEHLRLHREYPDVTVFGGSIFNQNPESWLSRAAFVCEFTGYSRKDKAGNRTVVPSVNMSVKRTDVLNSTVRMPDGALPGGEDVYFCSALIERGFRIRFDPTPAVGHLNRQTWPAFIGHMRSSGYAAGSVARKYSVPYDFISLIGPLAVFAAPVRLVIVLVRLIRADLRAFAESLAISPALLWGFTIHMWAYYRGASDKEPKNTGS